MNWSNVNWSFMRNGYHVTEEYDSEFMDIGSSGLHNLQRIQDWMYEIVENQNILESPPNFFDKTPARREEYIQRPKTTKYFC